MMNRNLQFLLFSQFLSAFADNAILFTVIAMVLQDHALPAWYVPALQSTFLVAFVVLAPWVGRLSDRVAKPRVLILGNLIKAIGALMIMAQLEPLLAYGLVGLGAAVYSPAKYGILPELASKQAMVKANSWIEGATICAILLGTVVGARIADHSTQLALQVIVILYLVSIAASLWIHLATPSAGYPHHSIRFSQQTRQFLQSGNASFSIVGSSLFWATAALLRVIIVAWAPLVLLTDNASDIADITLFMAIGIILGSVLVPRLIGIDQLGRTRFAAYAMAIAVMALAMASSELAAKLVMLGIGTAAGIFIVPLNACLQQLGHQMIGGGGAAVAIQNFFANLAMLLSVGIYTLAAAHGADPVASLWVLAIAVLLATALASRIIQRQQRSVALTPAGEETADQ